MNQFIYLKKYGILGILGFLFSLISVSLQAQPWNMGNNDVTVNCAENGGLFHDSGGPTNNYQDNENFTFVFRPGVTGMQIEVDFTAFDVENGWDFLDIYNGPTIASPLIASLTGVLTGQVRSTAPGGELTFRFRSDFIINRPGWTANVRLISVLPQTGTATLTSCCGRIYDPGWRQNYQNNNNVTFTVNPTANSCSNVNMTFVNDAGNRIWAECCCDRLTLHDGPTIGAPIAGYANLNTCTQPPVAAAVSTHASGAITLEWRSDFAVIDRGFIIDLSCTPKPPLTATATATPASVCTGGSSTLDASSNRTATYTWMPGNLTGPSVTVSPAVTTTYTLTAAEAGTGCSATATVTVTVNPDPTFTVGSNSPACEGGNLDLTLNGCTNCNTYAWAGPNGFTANVQNPTRTNVVPADAGTYTVTVTSAAGCTATGAVAVVVNPATTLTVTPSSASICEGQSVSITASGANTYTWMPGNLNGATQNLSPAATTTYTITGVAVNGCQGTATVTVTVNLLPTVTAAASPNPVCANATLTLTGTCPTCTGWSWTGPNGFSSTLQNPTIANIPVAGAGVYTLVGTTAAGCSANGTVNVAVNPPPTITVTPATQTICADAAPVTFTASGAVSYVWSTGAVTPDITVNPGVTTVYTVTGTDAIGCQGFGTATLTVNPNPAPPTVTGSIGLVCPDQRGTQYSVAQNPGMTYNWTVPGGATLVSGQGTNAIVVDWTAGGVPTVSGSYQITINSILNGCQSINATTINVTVQNPPPAQPSVPNGPTPICRGTSGAYSVVNDPTATLYTWSNLPNGAFISSGVGTNAVTINWGAAVPGTYTINVTASNSCGTSTPNSIIVEVIDVRPQPSVITPPADICVGIAGTFTTALDPDATTYTWSNTCGWAGTSTTNSIDYTPAPGGPCVITVVANNACGSSAPRSITVFPRDVPAQPLPVSGVTVVCPNQVENYSVPPVNGVTYTWGTLPAGANYVSGQGTATVRINWGTATPQSHTLTVTPSNACGNGTVQSLDVTILGIPDVPDAVNGPFALCQGQSGLFSVNTPVQGVTYVWSVTPAGPSLSPSGSTATVVFTTPGVFTISVAAQNQCGISAEQTMTTTIVAPTTIVTTPTVTTCNPTVSLTATPGGGTWACVSCPGGAAIDNFGNVSGLSNPGGVYVFSYTVNNPPCASATAFATVRYDAAVGGTVSAPQTICSGGNGNVSLTGQSGSVIRWERSTDCITYAPIQNVSNTLTFINLTQTTCFRAVVQRGNCPPQNSSSVQITVIPRVTATATPATQNVCVANATVTGTLPPNTTGTWTFVSGPQVPNVVTAGVTGNITGMTVPGTYVFRWTLSNPPCPAVSVDVTVTRVPALTVPNAGSDQTVCADRATLVGNIPVNGTASWSVVSGNPMPTLTNIGQNLAVADGMTTPGTYVFRYTISSPTCGTLTDDVVITRAEPPTVANAGLDQTTCDAVATVVANVPPITGTGVWSFVTGPVPAAITQSLNLGNITGMTQPGTYCFRYMIMNPPCQPSTDDVCITVTPQPSPAQVGVTTYNICEQTTATLRALRPQVGTGTWSFVSGPNPAPTVVTQGTDGLVTGLTGVGSYVFRWTVTSTGCTGSSSVDVTVNREALITENISAGPNQVLCNVTTTTLNSPTPIPPRSVGEWKYVSGPVPNVTVVTNGTSASVINMDLPGIYVFEWEVRRQTGSCPPVSIGMTVEVKPTPTTANAGPDQTICATTATLTGNIPQVGTGAWTQVSGPGSTITPNNNVANISGLNQNATYCYRWTIANAPCTPSTDDVCLIVSTASIGGQVTGDNTVCTGTNTGTLTLTGHSGNIIRWESSINNFGTFTPINNTTATFTYTNLTQTTSYRAVLRNGSCPEVISGFATITVRQNPTVANAGADREFCGSISSTTIAGNTPLQGTPTWVFLTGPTQPSMSMNGNLLTVSGVTIPGTYCFQYRIENAPCAPSTDDVCITLYATSNGGTISAPATVCTGINNGTLTLTGNVGNVVRWESSTNNGVNWTPIQQTSTTLGYLNITQTTIYRAVVKNGTCPEANSASVQILVSGTPGVANAGADLSFCGNVTSATVTGNVPQNGTGAWTFVAGPIGATPSVVSNNNVADITNMNLDGVYVFRYTITNAPCPPVFDDMAITRFTQTIPGLLSQSATVCSGNNSGTLTLSGNNGNVVRWERSNDNFVGNIISLANTTTNLPYSGLTEVTQYRAVVKAGSCAEAVSNVVTINVVQPPSQANGGPNVTVCGPDVTLNAVAPGFGVGTWTFVNGGSPVNITQIGTQLNVTGMAQVGTYTFRWTVTNPPCQPTTADVIVSRLPDAPVANGGADVTTCNTTVTLNGSNAGSGVPMWSQVSGPNASLVNSGTQAILTNLVTGTYVFRYTITQSPCPPSTDDVIVTVVDRPSAAQVTNQSIIVCDASTATLSALPPQVGTGVWTVVSGGASVSNPNDPNSMVTGINTNGTYVFRWSVSNPPCNIVNTVDVVVTRQNGLGVNAFAGADQMVCNQQFALVLGNQPPLGATGQWAYVDGPAPASITTVGNFGSITQMSLPGVYRFSWTITPTNGCPPSSSIVSVTRVAPPTVASAGPIQTICGNSATIIGNTPLEGTGTWTFVSGPNGSNPNLNIQGTSLTASALDISGTYIFRWTIANPPCTPSAVDIPITVFEPTSSGTLQGEATVCSGNNSGTLTLTNFEGTVARWERSTDNFFNFTLINNVSPNLPYNNLTQSTCYRAVVKNGSCPEATSNIVCVNVVPPVTPADAGQDQTICADNITLTGNMPMSGTPMWSFVSGPNGANPQLNPIQNTVVVTNLTVAGNYLFRYTIDNAPCGNSSDLVFVTVNGASSAGVAASNTTVCASNNSGFITLTGFTGTVVRWESSNDPQFTPITNIANTTATQTYGGLTQTTYYRAVVRSGQCNEAVSNVVEVLVRQITQANAGPSQNLCGVTTATVNGNQPVNGTGTWSFVSGPQGATPSVTTNGTQGDITGLTVGGVYTFRWTINNPPCAPSSATTTINVAPLTVGGSVSSAQTVCGGVNTGTLVLSGAVGNVVRWESSTDNLFTNPIIHQNPTVQHTFVNLTQTTWYRAVVQSGTCQQAFSAAVRITVVQPTAPANAGNNQTVCTTTTTLTGNVPNSGTATWTFVTGPTTPTIVANNNIANVSGMTVAGNYVFRYDITNAPCQSSAANVQVTVLNPVNTGTISAPATVCAVNNSGALTLSGNGGAVVRWEFSTDSGLNWTPIQNTGNTLTYSGLTQDRWYRAAINGGVCGTIFTAPVMITVNQPAVAGTLLGAATVCSGDNAGQILLTGQSGNIVRWESSVNGGQTWNNLVNNTNTQLYNNLTQTTAFRAVVQNGVCPEAFTAAIVITVTPASNGGMVMNNMTVCTGQNSGTVVLSGHNGTVVRWESSTDGSNWSTIANVSTSQVFAGLTQTTLFRAVVQTANCPTANSVPAIITVASGTVAGTLSAPQTVCSGNNGGTLNVLGNVGDIVRWEVSTDGGNNFTVINNTTPTLAFSNLNQSSIYRVFVQNGSCAGVFTNTVQVTVEGGANAGTINGSAAVCAGNNFGTLTLTGNGGTILRWESSVDGGVTFTSISNTTATQTYSNLTQTTIYRAVVSSQLCGGQAFSTPATVTVSQPSFAGIILGAQDGCGSFINGTLNVVSFVGNVVRWEFSNDNVNFSPTNENGTSLTYNVNQTTFFRVVVKNGGCPEAISESVAVRVSPPSVGGTVTGNATVCDANNGGSVLLVNHVGNIIRWESSTNGGITWSPINLTNNPLVYTGLTQTTAYRAVVQSGTCAPAFSSSATITVLGNLTLNAQGVVGCTSIGSIFAAASGGSGQYTYKISPPVAPDNDNGQFVNLPSGNYTITAIDANGCSISTQLFLPLTQTAPVINPVTNVTLNSAFITWPTVPPGSGVIYTLRYRIMGTTTWTTISNITNTFQLLQNLQNNTTYEIQLAYRCSANGPLSQFSEGLVTQFTTQSMGNCTNSNPVPIPGGFFVDQVTNTSFRANWNRVPDAIGYIVSWGRTNQDPNVWSQTIVCDPTQSFLITSLTPNTSYGVRIRTNCSNCTTAINNNDRRSAWSIINTVTTPASRDLESLSSNNSNDVQVYPNPNNGFFNVSFDASTEENIVIHLTDVTGRTLFTRNITAKVGNNEVPFELNGYASGVYMLRVVRGGQAQTTKIVVE